MGKKFKKAVFAVVAIVVSYYTGQAWLGKLLYAYGVSQLANVAISAFTKTRRTQAPPINVTIRGTIEPRRLVFGTRRCGGVLVFYATSGTDNKYLWYVIAYAGHQCSAFGDFWLDERRIDGSLVPAGAGGTVSGFNGRINIWKHLGTSAQTVDTNLSAAFGAWTTSHKLQGICYAVIRFERDDEIFPDGAPQSVSAEIDGMLTYDARLDSTNGGSGAHRYANPSTWAFSRDPVQHVRWFLTGGSVHNDLSTCLKMYGLREQDTRIDDAYTIAASNVCDETLSGANAPPSGSQSRYRCDLETHTGETRREILQALLDSMAGTCVWVHGKWRIYAGHYDAPVHTITDQDLYGDLEVQDTVGHDVRYNAVAPIYFDSASQYIQTSGRYRTDSAYETQDGNERISKELLLDAVTDIYQAQRLAEIHLRQSRMMRTVRLTGALNLMKIAPYEGALFTHTRYGWTNRILRAKEKGFEAQEEAGKVTVLTQRDDPGVWTDMLTADYDAGTSSTDEFTQDGPETPAGLTATPRTFSIEFVITPPTYMRPGAVIELWEHTASTPFSSATKIADIPGGTTHYVLAKNDFVTRYYWIRQRDQQGAVSGTFPSSTGIAGVATVESSFGWNVDVAGKPAGIRGIEGIADRSQVSLAGIGLRITSSPDTTVGYGFPAIPIDDTSTYWLTIRHKSSGSSADGLYLRFNELDTALPSGKTHIGTSISGTVEGVVAERTSIVDLVSNGLMPGAIVIESTYTYTPTSGTKFASFSMYNYDPATAGVSYEVEWVRLTRTGSYVNLLSSTGPMSDSTNLVPGAATETYSGTASSVSTSDPSTFTDVIRLSFTPDFDCDVAFFITYKAQTSSGITGGADPHIKQGATSTSGFGQSFNTTKAAFSEQVRASVVAGTLVEAYFQIVGGSGGATVTVSDATAILAVFKR